MSVCTLGTVLYYTVYICNSPRHSRSGYPTACFSVAQVITHSWYFCALRRLVVLEDDKPQPQGRTLVLCSHTRSDPFKYRRCAVIH